MNIYIFLFLFLHCKEKYKEYFSSYELKLYSLIERKFKLKRNKSFKLEDNIKHHAISHLFPVFVQTYKKYTCSCVIFYIFLFPSVLIYF